MAYWSYHGGASATSSIDTILDKDEFELSELLADDELLQECKAQNARLIAYLCKPEVIEQLFTFVVVEPTAEDSNERCYMFPYVSSELLSCDVSQLHEAIGSEQCAPHLRTLLHFPEAAGPLNPVLIGYYGKVVSALFKRAPHNFLETLDAHAHGGRHGYLKMLLGHLDLQSVADLLATLTAPLEAQGAPPPPPMMLGGLHAREPPRQAGPAEPDADEEPEQWLDGPEFACMLLDAVLGSSSAEVHALAATLFAGLVGHYGWGAMVAHLPLVAGLVEVALEAPAQSARTCGLCMLTELLRLHAFERASVEDEGEAARRDAQLAPLVAALGEQIEGFVAQLNVEPVLPSHLETFLHSGGFADSLQVMPVGSARIARYAFLAKLLPYCDGEACLALVECRLLEIALDAFGRYACNNALHTHVTALVLFALKEEAPAELTHALLSEARLASRLAASADAGAAPRADEDPAVAAADSSGPAPAAPARAPNFGHVLVMANALVAAEERSEAVRAALATDAAWRAFVDGPLAAANANERLTLGGQAPHRNSEQDDSDEDEVFSSRELDLDAMAAALAKHQAASARSGEFGGGDDDGDDDGDGEGSGDGEGEGEGGFSSADIGEMEQRFGQYMERKNFLHELDGGLSAISREQDDQAERASRGWDAEFGQDEEGGGGPPRGAFGTTQSGGFFRGAEGGAEGSDDEEEEEGLPRGGGAGLGARASAEGSADAGSGASSSDDFFAGSASLGGGGGGSGVSVSGGGGSFDAVFGSFGDAGGGSGSGGGANGGSVGGGGGSFDAVFGNFGDAGGGSYGGDGDALLSGASPFAADFGELSSEAAQQAGAAGDCARADGEEAALGAAAEEAAADTGEGEGAAADAFDAAFGDIDSPLEVGTDAGESHALSSPREGGAAHPAEEHTGRAEGGADASSAGASGGGAAQRPSSPGAASDASGASTPQTAASPSTSLRSSGAEAASPTRSPSPAGKKAPFSFDDDFDEPDDEGDDAAGGPAGGAGSNGVVAGRGDDDDEYDSGGSPAPSAAAQPALAGAFSADFELAGDELEGASVLGDPELEGSDQAPPSAASAESARAGEGEW